ncbi:MAG: ABC transporter permease [Proteobacteria bacterium]|nr:ABC transporter permease [Pseudomonadota bacterium]MBI3496982.1 ABC transporter permease [Pseudomonadota bacterium]
MVDYIVRKIWESLLVCITVSIATFALIHWTGDLAMSIGGMEASREEVERIRAFYGFDRSLIAQYLGWAGRVVLGDFGASFFSHEDVFRMIVGRLPVTVILAVASLSLALIAAVPLGVLAANRTGSFTDRVCLAVGVLGQAMPSYWSALLLILLFGVKLQILPISGTDSWRNFVLPSLALAWFVMPVLMRLTRAGMIEALGSDYIRTARAKGLPSRVVLFKHALRNAILPVVSVAMVQFGFLLGGSIVIESVFALNGIGLLAWNAIQRSDFPVTQAIVMIVAALFVLLNLLADLLNGLLDPRIRMT